MSREASHISEDIKKLHLSSAIESKNLEEFTIHLRSLTQEELESIRYTPSESVLHKIISSGSDEMVDIFIEYTSSLGNTARLINTPNAMGLTSLHYCVICKNSPSILSKLVSQGGDLTAKTTALHTPINYAIHFGKYDFFETAISLLDQENVRILLTDRDRAGLTVLHHSWCSDDGLKIALKLIEMRADIEARDNNGRTPLFYSLCQPELTKKLIESGASFEARDETEQTILHLAFRNGLPYFNKKIVEFILSSMRTKEKESLLDEVDYATHKTLRELFAIRNLELSLSEELDKMHTPQDSEGEDDSYDSCSVAGCDADSAFLSSASAADPDLLGHGHS